MILFNTFESSFYDESVGAYNYSISTPSDPVDGNKNFYVNLKLCESFINAIEIYEQSTLTSEFNETLSIPNFKFNLDKLTLTSNFSFLSDSADAGIENANITYIVRYPNETIIDIMEYSTNENGTHLFNYNITDSLPIGNGYSVIIYARSDYFKMKSLTKNFNVISGLELISGLEDVDSLYQGQTTNLTLVINNTRNEFINLSMIIEGEEIISNPVQVAFTPLNTTTIKTNFSIRTDQTTSSNRKVCFYSSSI
jgi:hypothetical protein